MDRNMTETLSICKSKEDADDTLESLNQYLMIDCWIAQRTLIDKILGRWRIECPSQQLTEAGQYGPSLRRGFTLDD